jgi:hypothetical protein
MRHGAPPIQVAAIWDLQASSATNRRLPRASRVQGGASMKVFRLSIRGERRGSRRRVCRAGWLVTACFVLAGASSSAAQVCGDVNDSGGVTTGDALAVLRKAVGQPVALVCGGDCVTLEPRVQELEDTLASTQESLAEMQEVVASLQATLAGVSRNQNTILFEGVNVQVVDGSGSTGGTPNGRGNVIVGYNEASFDQVRTGSHNLVVGEEHAYSSFGGVVAGERNEILARGASVLGGKQNTASGLNSAVCGGNANVASGQYSSVGAGFANTASGINSAVSGGCENTASNTFAAVSGGQQQLASGQWSSVTGGFNNKATGSHTAVSGGSTHTANGQFNWKAGSLSEAQ